MPGKHIKHVRFAYKNTFHSPVIPTVGMPGLTYSGSTNTSSLGPITPPSNGMSLHPQPILKHASHQIRIHRYLEPAGIEWDLREPLANITRNHHSLSSRTVMEPATNPPMRYITITCASLPWSISVHASNGSYVTLEDVLTSLYRSLRTNITQAEFAGLPSAREQRRATEAYERRYRRIRHAGMYQEEKSGGMKRVDFLLGYTRFMGLINTGRHPDEWQLRVG